MTMTNIKKLVKIILSKHSITKKNTSLTSDSNDHYHKPADTILIKYSLFFFLWGGGGGVWIWSVISTFLKVVLYENLSQIMH